MNRKMGIGIYSISDGIGESLQDHKEMEHHKEVKDFERAVKSRKKAFGVDSGRVPQAACGFCAGGYEFAAGCDVAGFPCHSSGEDEVTNVGYKGTETRRTHREDLRLLV